MGKYRELAIRLENGDTVEEIADWLFKNSKHGLSRNQALEMAIFYTTEDMLPTSIMFFDELDKKIGDD